MYGKGGSTAVLTNGEVKQVNWVSELVFFDCVFVRKPKLCSTVGFYINAPIKRGKLWETTENWEIQFVQRRSSQIRGETSANAPRASHIIILKCLPWISHPLTLKHFTMIKRSHSFTFCSPRVGSISLK